jgi:hypothetical protein
MKPASSPLLLQPPARWIAPAILLAFTAPGESATEPALPVKTTSAAPYTVSPAAPGRVPIRSHYVPVSQEPVSLTTQLVPDDAVTPLMPENDDDVPADIADVKPWTFSLEVRSIYDDNIFLSAPGTEKKDFVFLITPSVTWRHGDAAKKYGSYAVVSYSPSASIFMDESDENSVDHTFRADAQKRWGKLALGVDGKFQRLSGATPELSDRVESDEFGGRLRARYDISNRTSLEGSAGFTRTNYREAVLADYDEWMGELFASYAFTERTRLAVGGAAGRMKVDGRETQDFQRVLVKASTDATGKLSFEAKGGAEFRQTGAGDKTTPVFNVTANYRPTERTNVSAGVYREVTASGTVDNENVTRTGASVKVSQKIGSRLTAGIEAGYEKMEYDTTEAGAIASGREDEYVFIRPSLRYEFREGRRAEIYYSYREDDSTVSNFDFEANQAGLAIGFDF